MQISSKLPPKSNTVPSHLMSDVALWGLLIALILVLTGCERCSKSPALATLSARTGQVDRDTQADMESWFDAQVGSEFDVGDGIRTAKKADAQLTLDDGSVLALEEETLIRFLDRPPGSKQQAIDLQLGDASLEAAKGGTVLSTLFGKAILEEGTRVQLTRSSEGLRFQIKVGSATFESSEGEKLDVAAGQVVQISLGGAVLETEEEAPPDQPESEPPAAEEPAPVTGTVAAEVRGSTVTLKGFEEKTFSKVTAGSHELKVGSTVKVGPGSSVTLTHGDDKAELAAGGTYIVGGAGRLVDAESGSIEITTEGKVAIQVPGGVIITDGGSSKITSLGKKGTNVEAQSGSVTLKGKNTETLKGGEAGKISTDGNVSVLGRGLSYADVETAAGENLVIHDPKPPTAVRFLFGSSCDEGVIRLSGTRTSVPGENYARGKNSVALLLGNGATSYALHCVEDGMEGPAKVKGKVTVLQDAGSRPVPKTAPHTVVEVNGRAYTVLYQNQLPSVALRWSKGPPGATSFKVHVGGRTYSTSGPSFHMASGALGEGTHTVYFEGGGMVSRQTSITILFDNATPTASLTTPTTVTAAPGEDVTLSGTALPGWQVEVDGKAVGQDAGSRFSVKTKVPKSGRPVSVRLTHPTRGTHIYLRRGSGEP